MIYRKLGFEVLYQIPGGWVRSPVKELHLSEGSNYDEAITTDGKTIQLNPAYTAILEFTGAFDKAGAPIFHGHLCIDENEDVWEVIFADGAFMLCRGEEVKPLSNDNAMKVTIVGDTIRNSALMIPDNGVEVLEAAEEKATGDQV